MLTVYVVICMITISTFMAVICIKGITQYLEHRSRSKPVVGNPKPVVYVATNRNHQGNCTGHYHVQEALGCIRSTEDYIYAIENGIERALNPSEEFIRGNSANGLSIPLKDLKVGQMVGMEPSRDKLLSRAWQDIYCCGAVTEVTSTVVTVQTTSPWLKGEVLRFGMDCQAIGPYNQVENYGHMLDPFWELTCEWGPNGCSRLIKEKG